MARIKLPNTVLLLRLRQNCIITVLPDKGGLLGVEIPLLGVMTDPLEECRVSPFYSVISESGLCYILQVHP